EPSPGRALELGTREISDLAEAGEREAEELGLLLARAPQDAAVGQHEPGAPDVIDLEPADDRVKALAAHRERAAAGQRLIVGEDRNGSAGGVERRFDVLPRAGRIRGEAALAEPLDRRIVAKALDQDAARAQRLPSTGMAGAAKSHRRAQLRGDAE